MSAKLDAALTEASTFEYRITRATARFGIITDCLYNSTRSRLLLTMTYMIVTVIVLQILLALLGTPDPIRAQLEWYIPPGRTAPLGAPFSNFSVQLRKGTSDPIVGAVLHASLIPYRAFPLNINIPPQNTSNLVHWVDCLSIMSGATTPQNKQDAILCDTPQFLEHADAVTNKDGIATWSNFTLRHGAATDYMLLVKLIKIGSATKTEISPADHLLPTLRSSLKIVPPTAQIDVHHFKFDSKTFEISMTANVKWQQPQSALQTAFSAVSAVGQLANSTGLIDFAKAGVEALPPPPLTLNPMCVFMALDLQHVVNFNIAQVPTGIMWDANISDHKTRFAPSKGATTTKGDGQVSVSGRLNSYTYGFYLLVSCFGVIQPISPFREETTPWPLSAIPTTVFPAIPELTNTDGSKDGGTLANLQARVASVTARLKTGTTMNAGTSQEYHTFSETDKVVMDVSVEWTPQATAQLAHVKYQTIFCELLEIPPDTGLVHMWGEMDYKSGPKRMTNASVDAQMSLDTSKNVLSGSAELTAHFTTSGTVGAYILWCSCETKPSTPKVVLIESAVSAEKSFFLVAPQPWETRSSSSSSASSSTIHEKLGSPWVSTPTLRILSKDGTPLSGKHVAVLSYGTASLKYDASSSDPDGFISFARIICTSVGFNVYNWSASSEAEAKPKPKTQVFGFFVDNILIGNHTITLSDNPKVSPSAFCNARIMYGTDSINTSEPLQSGIPPVLKLLVTDGYDRPLPNSIVRVRVPEPFILLCMTLGNSDPRAWRTSCPPTGNYQDLVADSQGWVKFYKQPSNTAFAVGGVVEENRKVGFTFECLQLSGGLTKTTSGFGNGSTTTTSSGGAANSHAADSLITSTSYMVFKVESLVRGVSLNLQVNRSGLTSFSDPITMKMVMSQSFWRFISKNPVPFAAIYPRLQFFSKPPGAFELYPGDEPQFIVTDGYPLEKDPKLFKHLILEVELFYSRSVYGAFAAAISFDGSARFLPSTIQLFNNIRFARQLKIIRPLKFSSAWDQLAITGVVAAQQPVLQVIDGRTPADRFVPYARVVAFIRLWDITTNKKIRDVNAFLNPQDLQYGALVDTTSDDGRPISLPALKNTGWAIFRKLTLAGIQPGAAFKVVYRIGLDVKTPLTALPTQQTTEDGMIEIEQDTIFFGGTPAPIVLATPQPYAVPDVPVPIVAAQPLPAPMLMIPWCDTASVKNYDVARASLAERTVGSILNDTDLGRHWYFQTDSYTTTNFFFTFSPSTSSGSYQLYTLYPGGKTPQLPVLVVSSANNIQIDTQPQANVSIGSPFSATVLVTAQGNIPMPGIGVVVTMKPTFQCDATNTYFPNTACGSVSGQVIAVTDVNGRATVTLIAETGVEGFYYLDFQLVTNGEDSLGALAKRSFKHLAESSGGVVNASALNDFSREVSDLLVEAVSDNVVGGGSGVTSAFTSSLLTPLLSVLQSGQSSLPFRIWSPVAKIEVTRPVDFGSFRPPSKEFPLDKVPVARVLNRYGVPVADVVVTVQAVASSSLSIKLEGASARTNSNGVATFPKLAITQSAGDGPVRLSFNSLGFASTTPFVVARAAASASSATKTTTPSAEASPTLLSNATVLPAPTAAELTLSEQMQLVAFVSLAALIPLLIANVRRTHVAWIVVAAVISIGVFIFEMVSLASVEFEWSAHGWIKGAYTIFYSVLLGCLMATVLYLLFLVQRKGRDAYESQTSGRLRRSYNYTRWLINVRRDNKAETIETQRQQKNAEIKESLLWKMQEKVEFILPFRIIQLVRVDDMDKMDPIPVPADLEPAELPLKYYIILGVGIIVTCSLFLVSFWASNIISLKIEDAISYLPRGDDTLRISTAQATGGEINVGVTVSAQEGSAKTQQALVSLLRLVAKNIQQLSFLNKWANFLESINIMGIIDTTRGILEYVAQYLPVGHAVAQVVALISLIVTIWLLGRSTRQVVIEMRRGLHRGVFRKSEFRKADEYIGFQAFLFAVQHQLVFWTVFLVIVVLLVLIFTKTFWPLVTPILIASIIPVVQTLSIELGAMKFIRSYRETVKNPFLYSVYSVVANVLGIFGALISLITRFVLGIVFMLAIFARADIGLFPACLASWDPAHNAFFCAMALDNRYNHPIFITAVAILSVEARIARMARREQHKSIGEEEESENAQDDMMLSPVAGAGASGAVVGGEPGESEQHHNNRVMPRVFAKLCSVPTVAALIQLHTQVVVDRWRRRQGVSVKRIDDETQPAFAAVNSPSSAEDRLDVEMLAVATGRGSKTSTSSSSKSGGGQIKFDLGMSLQSGGNSAAALTYPLATELYEEMQKSRRYVRAARRFQLLLLLHHNPSLRRFRKRALAAERAAAERAAAAGDERQHHYDTPSSIKSEQVHSSAPAAKITTAVAPTAIGETKNHNSEKKDDVESLFAASVHHNNDSRSDYSGL